MSPQEPTENPGVPGEDTDEPAGVFGNLPRTRPGARSPRRDSGAKAGARASRSSEPAEPKGAVSSEAAAESKARSQGPKPPPARDDRQAPQPSEGGGLEDVAWAGVAAAAEAATIGVRLATRALEAMRDAVERR